MRLRNSLESSSPLAEFHWTIAETRIWPDGSPTTNALPSVGRNPDSMLFLAPEEIVQQGRIEKTRKIRNSK
ncbi:hypothetical protein EUGRSUZ_C03323 [Eucalyptus grandis]|uniref:Uncharacterized protein n=2 Tax=Eucalyptus grandis TaxID=71139 RepID=A0ACC3LIC0_EUCGR|nr:hypothetical protein EUGRSUZ_C03323 [Eucalyptus grandis]